MICRGTAERDALRKKCPPWDDLDDGAISCKHGRGTLISSSHFLMLRESNSHTAKTSPGATSTISLLCVTGSMPTPTTCSFCRRIMATTKTVCSALLDSRSHANCTPARTRRRKGRLQGPRHGPQRQHRLCDVLQPGLAREGSGADRGLPECKGDIEGSNARKRTMSFVGGVVVWGQERQSISVVIVSCLRRNAPWRDFVAASRVWAQSVIAQSLLINVDSVDKWEESVCMWASSWLERPLPTASALPCRSWTFARRLPSTSRMSTFLQSRLALRAITSVCEDVFPMLLLRSEQQAGYNVLGGRGGGLATFLGCPSLLFALPYIEWRGYDLYAMQQSVAQLAAFADARDLAYKTSEVHRVLKYKFNERLSERVVRSLTSARQGVTQTSIRVCGIVALGSGGTHYYYALSHNTTPMHGMQCQSGQVIPRTT